MVKLGNFTVEIIQRDDEDNDVAVREHDDHEAEDSENVTTKYVEIKEDKKFSIKIVIDEDFELDEFDALWVSMIIDGVHESGIVFQEPCLNIGEETVKAIEGFQKSEGGRQILQPFRFEETQTRQRNADETEDQLKERFEAQGSIFLELCRVTGYSYPADEDSNLKTDLTRFPKDVVKEKGSTSRAGFDPNTETTKFDYFATTDIENPPMAAFRLKYRTIESLKDQGIATDTFVNTSHAPIAISDDEEESVPREELERLKRAHEAEIAELRKQIKVEQAEDFRETHNKKRKALPTSELGEVDLIQEQPAHRRKPNADDVVIELDD